MPQPSATPKKRSRKGLCGCLAGSALLVVALLAIPVALIFFAPVGCLGAYRYAKSAPPIEHTVELVESSREVAAAIGPPVTVSLAVARRFERDWARAQTGQDRVYLDTTVHGSRGEAHLTVSAQNLDSQGWAGSWEVELVGRRVLQDGAYRTQGGATLLSGRFTPDGHPVVGSH